MRIYKNINLIKAKIIQSNFLAAGFTVISSTLVKILSIFLITKYLSVKFGPEILGIYGQSQSFINLIIAFSTLSSSVGITKYLAEYKHNSFVRVKITLAAWDITFAGSFIVSVLIIIFSSVISKEFFFSEGYQSYVIFIGLSTFFIAAYKTRIAVLNGYHQFKKIGFWEIIFNICSSLVLVFTTFFFTESVIIAASIVYIGIFFLMNTRLKINPLKLFLRLKELKSVSIPLAKYSILIFIQVAIGYIVEMVLRTFLVKEMSLIDLGLYEGMNKISGAILLPVTSMISIYFLPLFANKIDAKFNPLIFSTLKKVVPLTAVVLVCVYFFRVIIIRIILSPEFEVLEGYLLMQMGGVFFSIINLIYLNALLGRGFIRLIFVLVVFFSLWYLLLFNIFVPQYGLYGAFLSYFLCSLTGAVLYIIVHVWNNKKLNL